MIEINLLPPNLRKKKKKQNPLRIPNIPKEAVIGLIGGEAALLFLAHVILTMAMVANFTQRGRLEDELKKVSSQWEEAKNILGELRTMQNKLSAIEKVTTQQRTSWSQKLNDISDSLPRGVWLNKLSLDRKILLIDGSAVSKERNEMISVGTFASSLKNQKTFTEGLENIEVSSIQKRLIKQTEVSDFLISVKLQ